jgi:hypothetical protein
MIRVNNCDGPVREADGSSFCPVRPDVNEWHCETCREYQVLCAQYEQAIDHMQQLERMIWGEGG